MKVLRLPPLGDNNLDALNRHVVEVNKRLEEVARALDDAKARQVLTGDLDAGGFRITNIGTSQSENDAISSSQMQGIFDDIDDAFLTAVTSEGSEEGVGGPGNLFRRGTSRFRRETEDAIIQAIQDAVAVNAPPNVAAASALGTTTDPPRFALEDHTHGGILGNPVAGGVAEQVTFFTSTFEIAGDVGLTYDSATDTLTVAETLQLNLLTPGGGIEFGKVTGTDTVPGPGGLALAAATGSTLGPNHLIIINPEITTWVGSNILFGFGLYQAFILGTQITLDSDVGTGPAVVQGMNLFGQFLIGDDSEGGPQFQVVTLSGGVANDPGVAQELTSTADVFGTNMQWSADGAACTVFSITAFYCLPDFVTSNGGTLDVTVVGGLDYRLTADAGVTFENTYAGFCEGVQGAATVTGDDQGWICTDPTATVLGRIVSFGSTGPLRTFRHVGHGIFGAYGEDLDVRGLLTLFLPSSSAGEELFRLETETGGGTSQNTQYRAFKTRVKTTDATPTTLFTYTMDTGKSVNFEAQIVARRTGGTAGTAEDSAGYDIRATVKNVAGTATMVTGSPTALVTHEDQAGWDAQIIVTGGDIEVEVTGAVDNDIAWSLTLFVHEVEE